MPPRSSPPPLPLSLSAQRVAEILAALGTEPAALIAPEAMPVHVLYGGAHLYRANTPEKLAKIARTAMATWGSDDHAFASMIGPRAAYVAEELAQRVREKLEGDAVEKICIDFEDGYGPRPDDEEDAEAVRAAGELARAPRGARTIVGIRIKALTAETARRATRTLDLFVTTLARETNGELPAGFTVTLPKVSQPEEITALTELLETLEKSLAIKERIGIELMVETPRAIVDADGKIALPALIAAARGRCIAAHLGAYDLTASLGVTAGEQRLDHPACELARLIMQMSLAGTGVTVVDGATTVLPTGTATEVHRAWSLHATAITRALALGIYQGWDLHPAQLPARYGAVYAFFLAERVAMAARLHSFVAKATQATRSGQIFDDAATGQGLLEFFVRGVACGALTKEDVVATGLTLDELRARSFAQIVAARGAS